MPSPPPPGSNFVRGGGSGALEEPEPAAGRPANYFYAFAAFRPGGITTILHTRRPCGASSGPWRNAKSARSITNPSAKTSRRPTLSNPSSCSPTMTQFISTHGSPKHPVKKYQEPDYDPLLAIHRFEGGGNHGPGRLKFPQTMTLKRSSTASSGSSRTRSLRWWSS